MSFTDFEFNGHRASEFGLMVCSFNGSGLETVDMGSNRVFTTVNRSSLDEFYDISSRHDEPFSTVIQVCKSKCDSMDEDITIEDTFVSFIMRWLLSKKSRKFKMIYTDAQCYDMYYIGKFTSVHGIKLGKKLIGLELTFKANNSFGFYESLEYEMNFSDTNSEFWINNLSDEEGCIYPHKLEITVLQDGDLTLSNSLQDDVVTIKNCKNGEVITMDGKNKVILSSIRPFIGSDFNYTFLKIINHIEDNFVEMKDNIFSASLPCIVNMAYSPICKMGVI